MTPPAPPLDAAEEPTLRRDGALDLLRENLEAFAIAIVMALVIKHFCLEAFRIPTSSMRPTLLGKDDAGPDREEDRIIVDKWAYLLGGPQRWDVMVFRYPLDASRNFIKRTAGLGGEWIRIAEGDLWVRRSQVDPWRPATKRRRVREQIYKVVYPPIVGDRSAYAGERTEGGRGGVERYWEAEGRLDGWRVEDYGRMEFEGGEAATLRYAPTIAAEGLAHARDVRMRLRVTPRGAGTLVLGWSPQGGWATSLRLALGDGGPEPSSVGWRGADAAGAPTPLALTLAAGRPTTIEWEIVDGEVHVHVQGEERAVLPFERNGGALEGRQALTLTASGAPLTIESLQIDRDLHYTLESGQRGELGTPQGLQVPPDSYFMLGDNTQSSSDSRAWKAGGVRLKDGREIWWNLSGSDSAQGPSSVPGGEGLRRVVDLEGVERRWNDSEESEEGLPERWVSFVPRANVVGRAFYIFWPAWPPFPRRLGWIH